jgi:hypothetical protein
VATVSSVWPQNRCRLFLPVWPQNRWLRVSRFGPQNQQWQFGDLGLKITVTVSWFGPQNQVSYDLSVAPQNWRGDEDGAGHALRSSILLRIDASLLGFSSLSENWRRRDDRWSTWHYHGDCIEVKLKTIRSMRWAALEPSIPPLPFSMY